MRFGISGEAVKQRYKKAVLHGRSLREGVSQTSGVWKELRNQDIASLKEQEQRQGDKGRKDFLRKNGRNSGRTFKIVRKHVITL